MFYTCKAGCPGDVEVKVLRGIDDHVQVSILLKKYNIVLSNHIYKNYIKQKMLEFCYIYFYILKFYLYILKKNISLNLQVILYSKQYNLLVSVK